MALHVNGSGNQPFLMNRKMHKVSFTAIVDSGSQITILTQADLGKILQVDVIFARPMPKREKYVDYNIQLLIFFWKTDGVEPKFENKFCIFKQNEGGEEPNESVCPKIGTTMRIAMTLSKKK